MEDIHSESFSVSSFESAKPNEANEILNWYERHFGYPLKRSWPELVGDNCIERAKSVVHLGSPYFVVTTDFKGSVLRQVENPLRVIFYLDNHGNIAVTPRVG